MQLGYWSLTMINGIRWYLAAWLTMIFMPFGWFGFRFLDWLSEEGVDAGVRELDRFFDR